MSKKEKKVKNTANVKIEIPNELWDKFRGGCDKDRKRTNDVLIELMSDWVKQQRKRAGRKVSEIKEIKESKEREIILRRRDLKKLHKDFYDEGSVD